MIPDPNVLEMEIFVTHMPDPKPKAPPTPTDTKYHTEELYDPYLDQLKPPAARFAQEGKRDRHDSFSSVDSHDSHITDTDHFDLAGPGEQPEVVDSLDLTNFDGDDDTAVPGEAQFSLKLRKTGKMRRSQSRHAASALKAKVELNKRGGQEKQGRGHVAQSWDGAGYPPPPRIVTPTPPTGPKRYSLQDTKQSGSSAEMYGSGAGTPYGTSTYDVSDSTRHLMGSKNQSTAEFGMPPQLSTGGAKLREDTMWDVDDEEYDDLEVISEKARPGKPKLEKILKDEVEASQGAVAVACECIAVYRDAGGR